MKRISLAVIALLGMGFLAPKVNAATFFYFTSSPTAWVGGGQTLTLTTNFSASRSGNTVTFSCSGYQLTIRGPNSSLPKVGFYPNASRYPFQGAGTGLAFTSPGRGNNTLSGCFNVLQADYDLASGQVTAFAVDFVQYDETNVTRWNRGNIRFNSDVVSPGPPPAMLLTKPVLSSSFVQFAMSGPPDTTCIIQRSSDLVNWTPYQTNAISPVGLLQFFDVAPVGGLERFFRVVSVSLPTNVSNDNFTNRFQIPSVGGTVTGSNTNATRENGEPFHWQTTGGKSVWWKWQAPLSGTVTIGTAGSSFDTIMAAYTGTTVSGLSLVANNDDYNGLTSRISFFAVAGTTYQIAVDGYDGASGNISLFVQQ